MTRSLACALVLVGCVAPRAAAQDARAARGQQLYADQKCSLCHSIAGKGNAKGSLEAGKRRD